MSNPGCHATGAIAPLRPLVDAGLLPVDIPVFTRCRSVAARVAGAMIEAYEAGAALASKPLRAGPESHKHVPEIMLHGGLSRRPIFVPHVGNFAQGMLVNQLPLHLDAPSPRASIRFAGPDERHCPALAMGQRGRPADGRLDALALNGTNRMEIRVYGREPPAVRVAVALDNLGRARSGAAVQNLRLMFGL